MRWLSRVFGGDARAPRDVDSALRAALLSVLARDWDEAERLLVAAARFDSSAVEPYLALARLCRQRGEIGRAIRLHQNLLLRLDPRSEQGLMALEDLAADFRQGGFLRRAIASYEELLALAPGHRGALRALVRLHTEARDFERAIELARRRARAEGGDASRAEAGLRVQMAEALLAEGRSDEARRAVKRALRRDRESVRGWILLGSLEAERQRAKAALAAWARVPRIDRKSGAQVYPQLEATYAALGRAREFETWLRGLLAEQPEDPAARIALARHLAARGEVDEAVAELRRVIAGASDDLEARATLGRVLLAEHRDTEAVKEYAELLDVLERRRLPEPGEGLA
jgi:lipopolysaccharide biosynthesis regulator YciM